jgi:transglycosylase-like protein with SLT domain
VERFGMRSVVPVVAATMLSACSPSVESAWRTGSPAPKGATPALTPAPVPSITPSAASSPSPDAFLPAPSRAIPGRAPDLAAAIARTTSELRRSLEGWVEARIGRKPPEAAVLQALYQQRMYRLLARNPLLAARAIALLPGWLRTEARANVTAGARLFSLVKPVRSAGGWGTGPPPPAARLLETYREAERRFGVDWEVLAAVNFVESKFCRTRSASPAGAQGPMQFLPSTWARYGLGGNVHDAHDAILGAANYLHASGAPGDDRRALYAYNHSTAYVEAVLLYASQIRGNWRDFLAYYNWQVFVVTTRGDERVSGPGIPTGG